MRALIIGAGPAGSSAAGLLAREGHDVLVIERAEFPRHHVGESLQPATLKLLDEHMALGEPIRAAGFARKYGAAYVWGESREPWTVLFDRRLEGGELTEPELLSGDYEHAVQVDRARFDQILVEGARALGATFQFGVRVQSVEFEGERATGLRLESGDLLHADVVLDASGQGCLLGRQLDLVRMVADLRCAASYGYVDGAGGFPGALGRHIQWVVTTEDGWAWFIPISATRTSVGVVHRSGGVMDHAALQGALRRAGFPIAGAAWLEGPGGPVRFAKDWSFTCSRFAGPGWYLLGDAACFVDPILSGGVDFAVRSGFRAALQIASGAQDPEEYDRESRTEYKAYLRMARYWYGNNRSRDGLFWEAKRQIPGHATATPLRAFVYLTTGTYAAERHLKIFQEWQEKKMFGALGVDAAELQRARRERS